MTEVRTRVGPLIHPLGYSAKARVNTAVSTLAWFHREHRNRLATAGAFPVNTQGHFKTTLSADETAPACSRFRTVMGENDCPGSLSEASAVHFLHTDPVSPVGGLATKRKRLKDHCDCVGFTSLEHEIKDNVQWHPTKHPWPDLVGWAFETVVREASKNVAIPSDYTPFQHFDLHIYNKVLNQNDLTICFDAQQTYSWYNTKEWPAVPFNN